MGSNAAAMLKMAAIVLGALFLISLGVGIIYSAAEPTKGAKEEFSSLSSELADQKFSQYEDATVSGSEVSSAIRRLEKEGKEGTIGVRVVTGQDTAGTWYYNTVSNDGDAITTSSSEVKETNTATSTRYINTAASFKSKIVRNSSNVIRAVIFEQVN